MRRIIILLVAGILVALFTADATNIIRKGVIRKVAIPTTVVADTITDTIVLDSFTIQDADIARWAGTTNNGNGVGLDCRRSSVKVGLMRFDLSGITAATVEVVSAACSLHAGWNNAAVSDDYYIYRLKTDFTEGVEVGAVVADGHTGVTWNCAIDSSNLGADVLWRVGGTTSFDTIPAGDNMTDSRDTVAGITTSYADVVFDNANFADDLEKMINGDSGYETPGFAIRVTGTGGGIIESTENTLSSGAYRPKLVIIYKYVE